MTATVRNNKFSGSVGAGMKSLFTPGGRTFYVLEHKLSSTNHKAGEKQEIIVDYIELGRDPKCQVRFDESFSTVSRRHAAIIKDGDNWKIRQLSDTNDTLLNGRPIKKEWYLQNGDEIQLSVGGPKLGFLIPQKNTIGSIGLSHRLSLFRQQAMRPYRTAIVALSIFIILLAVGAIVGGRMLWSEKERMSGEMVAMIEDYRIKQQEFEAYQQRSQQERDSLQQVHQQQIDNISANLSRRPTAVSGGGSGGVNQASLQQCMDDVYFLYAHKVIVNHNGNEIEVPNYQWGGTAFLLDDGRLMTARHCVFSWLYPSSTPALFTSRMSHAGADVTAYLIAVSQKGDQIQLTSKNFNHTNRSDYTYDWEGKTDEDGYPIITTIGRLNDTDWAYAKINRAGNISYDNNLSTNLPAGSTLSIIGFPQFMGVVDGGREIVPQYNEVITAQNGLNTDNMITVSNNIDHGNSGGPAFIQKDGKLIAVGIASRSDSRSEKYAHYVPINSAK